MVNLIADMEACHSALRLRRKAFLRLQEPVACHNLRLRLRCYITQHYAALHLRTLIGINKRSGNFLNKARLRIEHRLTAIEHTHLAVADEQMLLRTRNAYIAQAALLLNLVFIKQSACMWENALLQTNEEDCRELQTFGRMQRHQGQRIISQLCIINIRYERNIRQEALQRCLLAVTCSFFRKVLRYTQKLLQVFDTALILRTIAALQLCQIACFVQNILHKLLHRRLGSLAHQIKKNLAQLIQLIGKAAAESRNISGVRHYLEQALLAACRISLQLAQRRITDTAARHIDNTQQ